MSMETVVCPECNGQTGEVYLEEYDAEINEKLAAAWNLSDEEICEALWNHNSSNRRFVFAKAWWVCSECHNAVKLPRAYWNPDIRQFHPGLPRPRTPREQAEYERRQQEAAGQMRLL